MSVRPWARATVLAVLCAGVAVGAVGQGPPAAGQAVATTYTAVVWGSHEDVPEAARARVKAVSAGHVHSLALRTDGTVVAWGNGDQRQTDVPAGLTGVTAVAGGWLHSLALKADGTVVAWGNYGYAYVPPGLAGVTAIAARKHHDYSMALLADGTVVAWGGGYEGDVPAGLSGVRAISGGGTHSLALKTDGTVVAWGGNSHGQTDVPPGLSDVKAIAAGSYGSLALKRDGTVVSWGNTHGLPAGLTDVKAIASGGAGDLALRTDGTVVGSSGYGIPEPPPGLAGVRAISVGSYHALALAAVNPPPAAVRDLLATAGDGRVALTWTNPTDPDFWYTRILRSEVGFADSPTPDGDQRVIFYSAEPAFDDGYAPNGRTYYYTAFARDATGGWSGPATASATPVERNPPWVYRVGPPDGATDVRRDQGLRAYFSEAMDPASLDATTVLLRRQGTTTPVAAEVTYDDASATALLEPAVLLEAGATYVATVTTGASDAAGNHLVADRSWTFTVTTDATPPQVLATSPAPGAAGVDAATVVTATFSEDMRRSFTDRTVSLRVVGSAATVPATLAYDPSSRTVTLDPVADLAAGASYVARLTRRVRDLAGNPLASPVTWRFSVAPGAA